jgi:hypothetical protein
MSGLLKYKHDNGHSGIFCIKDNHVMFSGNMTNGNLTNLCIFSYRHKHNISMLFNSFGISKLSYKYYKGEFVYGKCRELTVDISDNTIMFISDTCKDNLKIINNTDTNQDIKSNRDSQKVTRFTYIDDIVQEKTRNRTNKSLLGIINMIKTLDFHDFEIPDLFLPKFPELE